MSTEVVHLRQRTLPSGARSLYLDYTIDGTRTKELLKMYLLPGSDRITKDQNRETMRAARMIQAKRTLDIQNGRAGIATRKGARVLLVDYMEERKAAYEKRGSTYAHTVRSTIRWVKKYKPRVTLGAVDEAFIRGFIAKLGNGVDDGSAYTYYTCLMIILNSAVRDKLIAANPSRFLDASEKPKGHSSTRAFLTLDEVRDLSEAPCRSAVLKRAFLFSCFCGLRKSDVQSLRWKDLTPGPKGGQLVTVVMQKTQKPIYIPLGANAEKWLPKRGNEDDLVFPGIPPSPHCREDARGLGEGRRTVEARYLPRGATYARNAPAHLWGGYLYRVRNPRAQECDHHADLRKDRGPEADRCDKRHPGPIG